MKLFDETKVPMPIQAGVVGSVIGVVLFGVITCFSIYCTRKGLPDYPWLLYLLVSVSGWCSGWLVALLYTPFDKPEADKARVTFQVLAGIASGYLVGKIDSLLSSQWFQDSLPQVLLGAAFFLETFLSTFLLVLVYRRYVEAPYLPKP
jgi:hypothetical protein